MVHILRAWCEYCCYSSNPLCRCFLVLLTAGESNRIVGLTRRCFRFGEHASRISGLDGVGNIRGYGIVPSHTLRRRCRQHAVHRRGGGTSQVFVGREHDNTATKEAQQHRMQTQLFFKPQAGGSGWKPTPPPCRTTVEPGSNLEPTRTNPASRHVAPGLVSSSSSARRENVVRAYTCTHTFIPRFNMRGGMALFAAEPAVLLNVKAAPPPLLGFLAESSAGNVLARRSWACRRRSNVVTSFPGHPHPRQPHPVTGRLHMQDFSSSAYWDKVYTCGIDDSGEAAVEEWHVGGEVMANAVKGLVGDPAAGREEELTLLNIGCGKSTLWER